MSSRKRKIDDDAKKAGVPSEKKHKATLKQCACGRGNERLHRDMDSVIDDICKEKDGPHPCNCRIQKLAEKLIAMTKRPNLEVDGTREGFICSYCDALADEGDDCTNCPSKCRGFVCLSCVEDGQFICKRCEDNGVKNRRRE